MSVENINKTFILDALPDTATTLSACTTMFTNLVQSCSGNTNIGLGTDLISLSNNLNVNGWVSGNTFSAITINANTFYSGGTNLLDLINSNDTFLTGATFQDNSLVLRRNDDVNISLLINNFSGLTVNGNLSVTGNTNISGNTSITGNIISGGTNLLNIFALAGSDTNTFVTGGTFNNTIDTITLTRNDNVNISITGITDYYTTGATFNNNILSLSDNSGATINTLINNLSGLTINGNLLLTGTTNISGNTTFGSNIISGGTNLSNIFKSINSLDVYTTGVTFNNNILSTTNNTGGTINTLINNLSGLTVNGNENINGNLIITGTTNISGNSSFASSIISGGTNLLNIFALAGSDTNTYVTGITNSNNNIIITRNDGQILSTNISTLSGLTINGNILVSGNTNLSGVTSFGSNIISGGTNLSNIFKSINSLDVYTTGVTLNNNILYFDRNDVLSAYTVNLSTFSSNDVYVTGGTFNNNNLLLRNNTGGTFNILINNFSGLTVNGSLSSNIISATTISGNTYYGNGSNITGINFNQLATTAHTHQISDIINLQSSLNNKFDKSGGTVSGDIFINGNVSILGTATTINTATLSVEDNIITLNSNVTGATQTPLLNSGFEVMRGSATTKTFQWDESNKRWSLDDNTIINGNLVITGNSNTQGTISSGGTNLNNIFKSINAIDVFVTGSTEIDGIIYFDRNDALSAFTADLTGLITNGNGTTANGTSIDLGGILTENTVISGGSQNLSLGTSDNQLSLLRINAIQGQEDYKYAGIGLEVTTNPGTFKTELDYTSAYGIKSSILQNPDNILIRAFGDSGDTESRLQVTGNLAQLSTTVSGTSNHSGLFLSKFSGYKFVDSRENTAGLEYGGDYSTGWTNNSLITKKYVDDEISALAAAEVFVTGATYSSNTFTFTNNTGGTFDTNFNTVTGLTINGTLLSDIISATTYQNLPIDIYVTGGTYSNGTSTFTNNTGGTFNVSGYYTGATDVYTTGATLSSTTLSFRRNDNASYSVNLTPIINNLWTAGTGSGAVVLSGSNSVASGKLAVAEGSGNTASANYSHAEGYLTTASGEFSHAEGNTTTASNLQSHAEGLSTRAAGYASHAEGYAANAVGDAAHAEGWVTYASNWSHSEGRSTTAYDNSHAEGFGTQSNGQGAHAEGISNLAQGPATHVEGYLSTAFGIASHVEGYYNTSLYTYGDYSSVGGQRNLASGNTAFIHSSGSTVIGDYSSILGGKGHRIIAGVTGSTILGGSFITGTTSDTVYGVNFNARNNITGNNFVFSGEASSGTIYNAGGYPIFNINKYGGGVFGGNNNGNINGDTNNVLGGSYLNGIILGGYTNTHNGYQGVIGGGFNTVTTNGTWNFVFSVGSTASAAAASVFGGGNHTASGAYSAVLGGEQNTASGIGAVVVGGNQASASGYRSFAQGYGSSAASDYAVVMGSYCSAVARSARAVGEYCVAAGVSSWVSGLGTLYGGTGQELKASGLVSFNHSYNDGTVLYRAAEGNYSAILGGRNHWINANAHSSTILGGNDNTINTSVTGSTILGGSRITGTTSDTVYGINFNASGSIFSGGTNLLNIFSTGGGSNTYVTGGTFNNNLLTLTRNDNVQVNTLINNFSGITVNGDVISNNTTRISQSNITGATTVDTINTGTTDGAVWHYTVKSSSNLRAGTVTAGWIGSSVVYNESSTTDIGDTDAITISVIESGGNILFVVTPSSGNWTIKLNRLLI